jgi:signal transduction histidine kinase
MKMYEFVDARRAEILESCLVRLREDGDGATDAELLNDLPHFMDGFVGVLRRDAGASKAETELESVERRGREAAEAAARGVTRKAQGFDATRIIHDYGILCDKLNELAESEKRVFSSREHQLMNVYLDEAMARGIEAFTAATVREVRHEQATILGALAHEIRNEVMGAGLAFSMIRKGQVGVAGRTAGVVERSLTRIEGLVRNALAEAAQERKTPVRAEHIRLADVLGELVDGAILERGVHIQIEVHADLYVDVEPRSFMSAVSNILQNAIKFTRDGTEVTLRARQTSDSTTIEVEDRCGGLDEGASEALFEPFVQGAPDPRGAGLGLHIARNAIRAHRGTITVRNRPDLGCVFTITLPRLVSPGGAHDVG